MLHEGFFAHEELDVVGRLDLGATCCCEVSGRGVASSLASAAKDVGALGPSLGVRRDLNLGREQGVGHIHLVAVVGTLAVGVGLVSHLGLKLGAMRKELPLLLPHFYNQG